ncbi:set and mynd domain containing protein, putative [Entamoeba dispar SAW760]|uniref:Set and mynd domain containing protein, putative n=1 Tax=Entamoeba dispar (strain ATCC PRA-260 / SAW760) TaxID=370354 RepID=B0ETF5_ENTDS|nr:set and mynd domain containing protein, putative [Entamoeba dispar SAW760]EDR22140.1 set and mynd domain containing protein, putative [Entamoeba dispar SAW760]|eukprot:EDR22140.1 set and mynd domain containing protein, putative [Entamoeba dispar SAW760]
MDSSLKYPEIGDEFDPRYHVLIPSKHDVQDRSDNPHWNSYEEIFRDNFPVRKFEVQEIPGKGRGLVCTDKIHQGEMVFKEKASVFYEGPEEDDDMKDSTYYMVKSIYFGTAFCTVQLAIQLGQNPDRVEEFSEHVDFMYQDLLKDDILEYPVKREDIAKIVNGIHTNSFALDFLDGYALFMACSLCNHSCRENMGWHTVGDTMYWTALQDIEVGTELTISYTFPSILPHRLKYFKENYGFICDCPLCSGPSDPWRAFKCGCGGRIYQEPEGWICHQCHKICTQEEINEFINEEVAFKKLKKPKRIQHFYNKTRKMDNSHIYMFKTLRSFVFDEKCPNPLILFEDYLVPIAKYQSSLCHSRLYSAILEQFGVALLKYAKKFPFQNQFCQDKAKKIFKIAYDYRCSLGMGITGYAAQEYIECLELFDEHKLEKYTEYVEY